jgi:3-oxoacyl-[acyl-carrier-protein] synthase II
MALALGANLLQGGVTPVVLAGGSDSISAFTTSGFNSLQALDSEPCRPFDVNRRGLNLGEGAAVLVLETLSHARSRGANILAVLRGWSMTNDASHTTAPDKDGRGLAHAIDIACEMAGVSKNEIGYVNAHGTGTPLNDIAETHAYELAFAGRTRPIPVSSTKSYIGHCLGAAGALEAAITVLAMRHGALVPTLRLKDPIASSTVEYLHGEIRHASLPVVMSVSAGFGGSNAALVFGSPDA